MGYTVVIRGGVYTLNTIASKIAMIDDIVELLYSHIRDISRRTYYRKHRETIGALSGLLWGYLDRETIETVKSFAVEE